MVPNWCDNILVLKHADQEMLRRAEAAYLRGKFAQAFLPMPAGYLKNHESFGWRRYHWGTQVDLGVGDYGRPPASRDGGVELRFDTAWGPPLPLYLELARLGYSVEVAFYEPDSDACGRIDGLNFTAVAIPCWKRRCIRRHIDADLVKRFGIDATARRERRKCTHGETSWSDTRHLELAVAEVRMRPHIMKEIMKEFMESVKAGAGGR